jgi:hypothetical protein
MLFPDFEFRDLRRRRDLWRLRLWQVKAAAMCVVIVLLLACFAVYIVRRTLIEGHPLPSVPTIWQQL